MTSRLNRIVDDLDAIGAWWPGLHADLVPGTRRRVVTVERELRPATHCPDCGAPIAWLVTSRQPYCTRAWSPEWPACSTAVALGFSPGSARVDVLDDLAMIRERVLRLELDVRTALGDGSRLTAGVEQLGARVTSEDVDVQLVERGHDTVWQPNTDPAWQPDPDPNLPDPRGFDWLRSRPRQVKLDPRRRVGGYSVDPAVGQALGYLRAAVTRLDEPGLHAVGGVLAQVVGLARHAAGAGRRAARVPKACPICDRLSLIVLEAVYDPDTGALRDLEPGDRRVALCTADGCVCEDEECACHQGRRHRWAEDDWERLGLVIADRDEAVRTTA